MHVFPNKPFKWFVLIPGEKPAAMQHGSRSDSSRHFSPVSLYLVLVTAVCGLAFTTWLSTMSLNQNPSSFHARQRRGSKEGVWTHGPVLETCYQSVLHKKNLSKRKEVIPSVTLVSNPGSWSLNQKSLHGGDSFPFVQWAWWEHLSRAVTFRTEVEHFCSFLGNRLRRNQCFNSLATGAHHICFKDEQSRNYRWIIMIIAFGCTEWLKNGCIYIHTVCFVLVKRIL